MINEYFYLKQNNVLFSRYLDFWIFVKSTELKSSDVIIGIDTKWKLPLGLFLFKCYENEMLSNTSVLFEKHFQLVFGSMLETGN